MNEQLVGNNKSPYIFPISIPSVEFTTNLIQIAERRDEIIIKLL